MKLRSTALAVVVLSISFASAANVKCPTKAPKPSKEVRAADENARWAGTVVIATVVDQAGRVRDPKVVCSLNKEYDRKALDAVSGWHLPPAMKDGKPVTVLVSIDVDFWLNSKGELIDSGMRDPNVKSK